jgi:hypothetical protein
MKWLEFPKNIHLICIILLVLSREWMGMEEWDYYVLLLIVIVDHSLIPSFPTKHQ